MSFRKEKKYRLSFSDLTSVKKQLFQTGMVSLHPTRLINSCYFDNSELKLFHESEEGVLPRKKFRIRWYNKSNIFTEEIKISSIEGRFKYQKKILNIHKTDELFDITIFDKFYGELKPILIVSYEREYFKFNDLIVYSIQAVASLSAGIFLTLTSWKVMNLICIIFLVTIVLSTLRADLKEKK
jgi:hypothetical protein